MENKIITKIQSKFNQNPKLFLILSISFFLITIIIIITIAIYSNLHDQRITITNLDSVAKNLPAYKKKELEELVYKAARTNSNYDKIKLSTTTATIRDHSFSETYDRYEKFFSGNFLVDIEDIKQSYHIYYHWSKDQDFLKNNPWYISSAECVTKSEAIYDYFKCKNPYGDSESEKYSSISMLLPYDTTENNLNIHFSKLEHYYDNGGFFVRITVDSCGDDSSLQYDTIAFKKYLEKYNLNPDDYKTILNKSCSRYDPNAEDHMHDFHEEDYH